MKLLEHPNVIRLYQVSEFKEEGAKEVGAEVAGVWIR